MLTKIIASILMILVVIGLLRVAFDFFKKIKILVLRYFLTMISCWVAFVMLKTSIQGLFSPSEPQALSVQASDSSMLVAIGSRYWDPNNGGSDPRRAKQFFEIAAKQNNPLALMRLGLMSMRGEACEKDRSKARSLFEQAAELGSGEAMCCLGMCYLYGIGVAVDVPKAITLYDASVKLNYAEGALRLGEIFNFGEFGVGQDLTKAREYYSIAANLGNDGAKKALENINLLGIATCS